MACLESIAYENGWIGKEDIERIAKPMLKNQYGQYLMSLLTARREVEQHD